MNVQTIGVLASAKSKGKILIHWYVCWSVGSNIHSTLCERFGLPFSRILDVTTVFPGFPTPGTVVHTWNLITKYSTPILYRSHFRMWVTIATNLCPIMSVKRRNIFTSKPAWTNAVTSLRLWYPVMECLETKPREYYKILQEASPRRSGKFYTETSNFMKMSIGTVRGKPHITLYEHHAEPNEPISPAVPLWQTFLKI